MRSTAENTKDRKMRIPLVDTFKKLSPALRVGYMISYTWGSMCICTHEEWKIIWIFRVHHPVIHDCHYVILFFHNFMYRWLCLQCTSVAMVLHCHIMISVGLTGKETGNGKQETADTERWLVCISHWQTNESVPHPHLQSLIQVRVNSKRISLASNLVGVIFTWTRLHYME